MTLFEIFKKHVLSPEEVLNRGIDRVLPPSTNPIIIKKKFSLYVDKIGAMAFDIYLKTEQEAGHKAIKEYLASEVPPGATKDEAIEITAKHFKEFDRFFLSLSQSRKPRAGGAFEDIIKMLFKRLKYPFQEQQVINGKPDFLMPSKKHYDKSAMDCIIFTAKRTLRERWRQIVTEGTRGLGFYLATIDDAVTEAQLQEMSRNRIYLVMPAGIKRSIQHYSKASNVLSFEEFFMLHLDPAVRRWEKNGII